MAGILAGLSGPAAAQDAPPPPSEFLEGDATPEPTGGPRPEDRFEPPFLGFYFGGAVGTAVDFQGRDICSRIAGCKDRRGFGLDLSIGARFSPQFKLQGSYDAFWHQGGDAVHPAVALLQSWRLDGRMTFPLPSNLEPFVQLGLGVYSFGDDVGVDTVGPGLQAGAGVDLALARWTSLVVTVLYRGVRLESFDGDLHVDELVMMHSVTATVGMSFGAGI